MGHTGMSNLTMSLLEVSIFRAFLYSLQACKYISTDSFGLCSPMGGYSGAFFGSCRSPIELKCYYTEFGMLGPPMKRPLLSRTMLIALMVALTASTLTTGPLSNAAPNDIPRWDCDTDLKADENSLPVCVLAFYNSNAQGSSPVIWWDKSGVSQPEPGCNDSTFQECARDWINKGNRAGGQAVMPACQDGGSDEYCISSIRIKSANTQRALDYIGADARVSGSNAVGDWRFGVPKGGIGSYWLDPLSGERYALSIVSYYFLGIESSLPGSQVRAQMYRTDISLTRVATLDTKNFESNLDLQRVADTVFDLDPNLTIELSVSFPERWTGFVAARISEMGLAATEMKGYSRVIFSGKPMQVSGAVVKPTKPSNEWNQILGESYPVNGGSFVTVFADFSRAEAFQKLTGDRATGQQTVWGMNMYPNHLQCGTDKTRFPGFSSSNGLFQASSVPQFSEGFFLFQVSDFHLRADGAINLGEYYFGIDADLAKCLYGFTKTPVSATISVTSEDGVDRAAVTTVFEKQGMVQISATNFTYSTKTIKSQILEQPRRSSTLKKYSSCKALNKAFKAGVAKNKRSVNRGQVAKLKPIVNERLYELNRTLDLDRDGIACER